MNVNKDTVIGVLDNLSKAGIAMWWYFVLHSDKEEISTSYKDLSTYHINVDTNKRGTKELIANRYLIENADGTYTFYPEPQLEKQVIQNWTGLF